MIRDDMICKVCGSVLSAVTFICVREKYHSMDPNQTWRDLCDALAADFNTLALDHAGNLLEWIRKGGFNPINCSHGGAQALLRTIIAELEP